MESCMAQTCAAATSGSSPMIFAHLLQTLLTAQCSLSQDSNYPPDRTPEVASNPNSDYDFVVIGGGSAGSVVASRLSENENWTILLIEAGENPSTMSEVPATILQLQGSPEDWAYDVEPNEKFCQGMIGKRCKWAKGKALGGSSVINAMVHLHGNKRDYDEWSKLGNSGWSYDEILNYLKKSENYPKQVLDKYGEKYFGTGGPLTLRTYNYTDSDMQQIIMNAVEERGVPILEIFNGEKNIGFGKAHGTIDNGVRVNAAKAFLSPVRLRKNLYVVKSARAEKIVVEDDRAKAVLVKLSDGKSVKIRATKEIIVSAGSIATPQILMLSGIGPKNHLTKFGIDTIADLSVGRNLQDHLIWMGLHLELKNSTSKSVDQEKFLLDQAYDYLVHRRGEFASIGGIDLVGFLNLDDSDAKYPNVQFHHTYIAHGQSFKVQGLMHAFNMDEDVTKTHLKMIMDSGVIFVCPVLIGPKSRGHLELRSNDPYDPVKIFPNYLEEQSDVDIFMKSVEFVRSLLDTETFKKHGIKIRHFPIAGCSSTIPDSREYWECNLRHTAGTIYHPVGTAKMGPSDDPEAVVDAELKVRGIRGLRVIDASIMPNIPSGNTNSPTLMIAEKGSDMIKREWMSRDEL